MDVELELCRGISLVLNRRGPVRARYIGFGDYAGVRCGITAYENTNTEVKIVTAILNQFRCAV